MKLCSTVYRRAGALRFVCTLPKGHPGNHGTNDTRTVPALTSKDVYTAYHRITGIPLEGDWDDFTSAAMHLETMGMGDIFRVTPRKVYSIVQVSA